MQVITRGVREIRFRFSPQQRAPQERECPLIRQFPLSPSIGKPTCLKLPVELHRCSPSDSERFQAITHEDGVILPDSRHCCALSRNVFMFDLPNSCAGNDYGLQDGERWGKVIGASVAITSQQKRLETCKAEARNRIRPSGSCGDRLNRNSAHCEDARGSTGYRIRASEHLDPDGKLSGDKLLSGMLEYWSCSREARQEARGSRRHFHL